MLRGSCMPSSVGLARYSFERHPFDPPIYQISTSTADPISSWHLWGQVGFLRSHAVFIRKGVPFYIRPPNLNLSSWSDVQLVPFGSSQFFSVQSAVRSDKPQLNSVPPTVHEIWTCQLILTKLVTFSVRAGFPLSDHMRWDGRPLILQSMHQILSSNANPIES